MPAPWSKELDENSLSSSGRTVVLGGETNDFSGYSADVGKNSIISSFCSGARNGMLKIALHIYDLLYWRRRGEIPA